MNAVDNHVGAELVISEDFADDARLAMVQRTHGVESVRGVPRPGLHRCLRDRHLGVGVANADAHLTFCRFGNHFHRAGNFGSNRQHANVAARGLPEAVEDSDGRCHQVFRRMHSAPLVAQKRSLEMNAQRPGLHRAICAGSLQSRPPAAPAPRKSSRAEQPPWSENIP